jgi:hypothetical protein
MRTDMTDLANEAGLGQARNGTEESVGTQGSFHGSTHSIHDLRLSGVLMQHGWFGLRLLYEVHETSHGATATELAARLVKPMDVIAATLSLLVRHDVLGVDGETYVCTEAGRALIEKVDVLATEPEVELLGAV